MGLKDLLAKQQAEKAEKHEREKASMEQTGAVTPGVSLRQHDSGPQNTDGSAQQVAGAVPREKVAGTGSLRDRLRKVKEESNGPAIAASSPVVAAVVESPTKEVEISNSLQPEPAIQHVSLAVVSPNSDTVTRPSRPTDEKERVVSNEVQVNLDELRRNLAYLAENIDQPALIASTVRTLGMQMRQNPELAAFMLDGDFDLLVRGFRRAYQVATMAKVEKRETKAKKGGAYSEFAQSMKDFDIKLD